MTFQPQSNDRTESPGLPSLQLPPVPFARAGSLHRAPVADTPVAYADMQDRVLPSGTSIDELMGALRLDMPSTHVAGPDAPAPGAQPDAPVDRPHAGFHGAVAERRRRDERRRAQRVTGDRRAFASQHMAAPDTGPLDPRPMSAPIVDATPRHPLPLDTRLIDLPEIDGLLPALPVQLPNRGAASAAVRTTGGSSASHGATSAWQLEPIGQPELASAPAPEAPPEPIVVPEARLAAGDMLDTIYDAPAEAGTGASMHPAAAAVAAQPGAWFAGSTHVDDAMLVWNTVPSEPAQGPFIPHGSAPIAHLPVMPAPAATRDDQLLARLDASAASGFATVAAPPGIAATPRLSFRAQRAAAAADDAIRSRARSRSRGSLRPLLHTLLLIGLPAALGIGFAIGLDRFIL